jgi:hypothetical protein
MAAKGDVETFHNSFYRISWTSFLANSTSFSAISVAFALFVNSTAFSANSIQLLDFLGKFSIRLSLIQSDTYSQQLMQIGEMPCDIKSQDKLGFGQYSDPAKHFEYDSDCISNACCLDIPMKHNDIYKSTHKTILFHLNQSTWHQDNSQMWLEKSSKTIQIEVKRMRLSIRFLSWWYGTTWCSFK